MCWEDIGGDFLTVTIVRPWLHTRDHNALQARFTHTTSFHVINLIKTMTQDESTDTIIESTISGVTLTASTAPLNPYEIVIVIKIPFTYYSYVPYLVSCDSLDISITE